ncbi:MAG TPA: aldo/keto reductase [Kofleriaceae bacterium]|jgi:diketogulonate reductase-like aldo/keto reductase
MLARAIPRSGEQLPVIGMGTWATFDVGASRAERDPLDAVLRTLFAAGTRVIDSSPMYGRSEAVVGDELARVAGPAPFLATKVWTTGKRAGIDQMQRSFERMRAPVIDLMQVHNLLDCATHLPVLREMKAAGTVRYIGVTHYQHDQLGAIETLMRSEQLDFIQIPYSIVDRVAEARILPAARDTGTAVLVMTPLETGALFARVRGHALPAIARELECTSWAQLFLKFVIGHPAVTCAIPATANPEHAADNARAGFGPMPDDAQRDALTETIP